MAKRINLRRVKANRTYRIDELAEATGTHRNTVRNWIKKGLPVIGGKPLLILGGDAIEFHRGRRAADRKVSPPGTIYCLACRTPRRPDGDMADFVVDDAGVGRLQGLCPFCGRLMSRIVNPTKVAQVAGDLDVHHVRRKPTL
ncbi:MerR family transcriptional regulator [Alsobacter sp. R-9]